MSTASTREAMQRLCEQAVQTVKRIGATPASYQGLSPFNDLSRNEPFEALPSFPAVSAGVRDLPDFSSRMGATSADSFVLQFHLQFSWTHTRRRI